jgi:GNAT superfamily N-acetyltransferase
VTTGNSPSKSRVDLSKLEIKPLDSKMDRAAFCCGNDELDGFFHDYAGDHHDKHLARVYVGIYEGEIVSYYWLVAQSHLPRKLSEEALGKLARIEFAPCIYLGMLGTQLEFQGKGTGKTMMLHAFAQILKVADQVGVYALTLEAVDKETAERYASWGFSYFIEGELLMFIPVSTIRQALAPAEP